jgi:hypothetical protein
MIIFAEDYRLAERICTPISVCCKKSEFKNDQMQSHSQQRPDCRAMASEDFELLRRI